MSVEFDQNKQKKTLLERGLDFGRSAQIFAGVHFTAQKQELTTKRGDLSLLAG